MRSIIFAGLIALVAPFTSSAQFLPPSAQANGTVPQSNILAPHAPQDAGVTLEDVAAETRRAITEQLKGADITSVTPDISRAITNEAPALPSSSRYGRIYTADHCEYHIREAEKQYNLPPFLLQAVALTESGRGGRPHPHAMNIKGRSHFADGTAEMERIVASEGGKRASIDVGCLQINLKWHAKRFRDWRSLLDPKFNAEYAAFHLTELYQEYGNWTEAVAAYHSRTRWRGRNYVCLVTRRYGQIFGAARGAGCGPNMEAMTRLMRGRFG